VFIQVLMSCIEENSGKLMLIGRNYGTIRISMKFIMNASVIICRVIFMNGSRVLMKVAAESGL
jgi:hypothetical protein